MLADSAAYWRRNSVTSSPDEEIYYSSPPSSSSLYARSPMNKRYQSSRLDSQQLLPPEYPRTYYRDHDPYRRSSADGKYIDSIEEMEGNAEFVQRREWMKRVAEWIAQTETMANYKPEHLDMIPEAREETLASSEVVLYVASPPSASVSPSPYGLIYTPSLSSSSSCSSSSSSPSSPPGGSLKNLKKTSHQRTSSLESISEEVEE